MPVIARRIAPLGNYAAGQTVTDNDLYAHVQLDNLIAQGAVDPFIMVFTRNDYSNWNFANILIDELIPYVEERYSVCADPDNRALGGLSMGGMQTINIGFPNADTFHYLMPSSSAPGIQGENQLFPDDGELARANLKLIFFSCGSGEVGAYGCNNNNTVRGYSETAGLGDIIEDFIFQGGGHDRNTWRPSFWNYAQLAHQAGFTNVETTCGTGGTGGMGGMGGNAGQGGSGGMGTGGGGAAGANGGTNTSGGSAGDGGGSSGAASGAGGSIPGGAGGTDAQGGMAGMSGSGMIGGAPATGGATSGAGGTGGASSTTGGIGGTAPTTGGTAPTTGGTAPTTGGMPAVAGSNNAGGGETPVEDGGCACSLPGSKSKTSPFALLAAAAAVVLGRARRQRRNPRG